MKGEEMKKADIKTTITAVAVIGLAATILGCSSATPTDTPGVDRMGRYVLKQDGPQLWTVLGYRFATTQIGDEWLILEVGLSSPSGQNATIKREDVFVRTPGGTKIPLATQAEFNEAWGKLRPVINSANVNRDPLSYFPEGREECAVQFFVAPGQGVVYDEVSVNNRRQCYGRLFFNVSGGIQQGRWVFGIDMPESETRIPFDLEE